MATNEALRREIAFLGRMFGDVLKRIEGDAAFDLVENVRAEARQACEGDASAGDRLAELLAGCSDRDLRIVIKAFSGFLELANLAEDRQRVRSLRRREAEQAPAPRRESVRAALHALRDKKLSAEQVAEAIASVDVELVFTAHPTEAKRKSLRSKLRKIRKLLSRLDSESLLEAEREEDNERLRVELTKLWQTDLVRPRAPTVMEEVQRGLSFQPVLWRTVPKVLGDLRDAVGECYPGVTPLDSPVLHFGSWMGGDRDGHPFVTPETTEETILWLRRDAIAAHRGVCDQLIDSMSIACEGGTPAEALLEAAEQAAQRWPEVAERLSWVAPFEGYRKWLHVIRWRLDQTAAGGIDTPPSAGEYHNGDELAADVKLLAEALLGTGNEEVLHAEVRPWLDQIASFGLRTARLDIRQHAGVYRGVMEEVWRATGLIGAEDQLDEADRQRLLLETLTIAPNLSPLGLSDDAWKTLDLFSVLRRVARRFGMSALGGHVISMTTSPSDLLTVLWLWRWSQRVDHYHRRGDAPANPGEVDDAQLLLPVVPLFETIDDLQHATDILTTTLDIPEYREHVKALGDRQMVMIGYSDSTKDGGYLAAAWALQAAQVEVFAAAEERGVQVTFFHGRGGALGRGGGPAARAILSLPSSAFEGSLRLTEQGEVLAERYDDPSVAYRHLEQVVWSVLMAATHETAEESQAWAEMMKKLADESFLAYRRLVDHAGFVPFFRTATPIGGIEGLAIGSRPAKRKKSDRIEDLRAIPWVFSWTQCRSILPAWYGLGSAVERALAESWVTPDALCDMYENWPFFRGAIDNSALAMAKSNPPVFRRYAQLAIEANGGEPSDAAHIAGLMESEHERTRRAILTITGCEELLDDIPWLQRSIQVRNGYVDPLNFVQIELMRRAANAGDLSEEEAAELNRLTQRAIKGVAAGLRTTG